MLEKVFRLKMKNIGPSPGISSISNQVLETNPCLKMFIDTEKVAPIPTEDFMSCKVQCPYSFFERAYDLETIFIPALGRITNRKYFWNWTKICFLEVLKVAQTIRISAFSFDQPK